MQITIVKLLSCSIPHECKQVKTEEHLRTAKEAKEINILTIAYFQFKIFLSMVTHENGDELN